MRPPSRTAVVFALALVGLLWWVLGDRLLPRPTPGASVLEVRGSALPASGVDPALRTQLQGTPGLPVAFAGLFERSLTARERTRLERGDGVTVLAAHGGGAYTLSVVSTGQGDRLDDLAAREDPPVVLSFSALPAPSPEGVVATGPSKRWLWFHRSVSVDQVYSLLSGVGVARGDVVPVHPDLGLWEVLLSADQAKRLAPYLRRNEPVPKPVNDLDEIRRVLGLTDPGPVSDAAAGFAMAADLAPPPGAGVIVAQWELCPPLTHHVALDGNADVGDPLTRCEEVVQDPDTGSFRFDDRVLHATRVAGVLTGNGKGLAPRNGMLGVAPGVVVRSYSILDRTRNYFQRADAAAHGVRIANNSWGYKALYSTLGKAYTSASWYNDALTAGVDAGGNALLPALRLLMVTTTGNEAGDGQFGSARIGNTSKNAVAVGAVAIVPPKADLAADAVADAALPALSAPWRLVPAAFSGRGPTVDGRIAPLVVAPGATALGGREWVEAPGGFDVGIPTLPGQPTVLTPRAYGSTFGTSFAAPAVAAMAARVQAQAQVACGVAPPPAMLRAALVHGSRDLVDAREHLVVEKEVGGAWKQGVEANGQGADGLLGPDQFFGWGLPEPESVERAARNWVAGVLEEGMLEYRFEIGDGAPAIKATLVWDDPPWGMDSSLDAALLHNDLDLELVHTDTGRRFLPWVWDPAGAAAAPATRAVLDRLEHAAPDMRDNRHTVEQVLLPHPAAGNWALRVRATRVGLGPQAFALVSSVFEAIDTTCGAVPSAVAVSHGPLPEEPLDRFSLVLLVLGLLVLVVALALLLDALFAAGADDGFAAGGVGVSAVAIGLLLVGLVVLGVVSNSG